VLRQLPGVAKTNVEALIRGDFAEFAKSQFHNSNDRKHLAKKSRYVDALDKTSLKMVPVFYSNAIDEEDQSFDIPMIFSMWFNSALNYVESARVEPLAHGILNTLRHANQTTGELNKVLIKKGIPQMGRLLTRSDESNTVNQLNAWMNQVIYHMDYGKNSLSYDVTTALRKYISLMGMGINAAAQTVNFVNG